MGDMIGYARVSTLEQDPALQHDALAAAGCARIFTDHASGARTDRPQLAAALDFLRPEDTLVVWKFDRLGRSLAHLIALTRELEDRGVGFRSLKRRSTRRRRAASSSFTSSGRSPSSNGI